MPETATELPTLAQRLEAILFASQGAMRANDLRHAVDLEGSGTPSVREVEALLRQMGREYASRSSSIELHRRGDPPEYQLMTRTELAPWLEPIYAQRPRPLSRAANETLAVVAYRQPVTRADIEFIRGVDAGSILKHLLERGLICCVGRRDDSPGRPLLFGTSNEFLTVFGIRSLAELPDLESFQPSRQAMREANRKLESPDQA